MGVLRAGFNGTVGQPSAQVIDGSLTFDNSKTTNLSRTPGSEGNRKTWTWSGWFNRQNIGANDNIFKVAGSSNKATQFTIMIHNGNYASIDYGGAFYLRSNRLLRDTSGWYHWVVTVDTTLSTANDRIRLYINGVQETSFHTRNNPSQNEDLGINRTSAHTISSGDSSGFDGLLSNFYLIDGQALGPENFGYTDGLTGTWRPKKYTGAFTGTNTFYLPMDGNSPIGDDKSGQGNNWTPVNFGGSVSLDNPIVSGARPILNTLTGGTTATPGVLGSRENKTFAVTVASVGGSNKYHFDGVDRPNPTLIRGVTYTFNQSDASNGGSGTHPLRFATAADAAGSTQYTDGVTVSKGVPGTSSTDYGGLFDGVNDYLAIPSSSDYAFGTGDFSVEAWLKTNPTGTYMNCINTRGAGGTTAGWTFSVESDNTIGFYSNGHQFGAAGTVTPGEWTHICVTRVSSVLRAFVNGVLIGYNGSHSQNYTNTSLSIGIHNDANGNGWYKGEMSDVRMLKGGIPSEFSTSATSLGTSVFTVNSKRTSVTNTKLLILQASSVTTATTIATGSITNNGVSLVQFDDLYSPITRITVPHNAPDTLYYYCTNHSGMGSSTSQITDETKADPYAWKNVLATPLVGSSADVSNSVNSGSTTKTITANGGAAASSAASNFYNGSFIFDGSGDYLSSSISSDLSFGTGNFTIECWVYQTSAASAEDGIFQISTTSGGLAATQSNTITLQTNGSVYRSYANDTSTAFSTAVITNKWVHLALVRSSTSLNLFVNGVKDATTISDSRNYSGTYLAIGGYYSTSYLWVGNISDFRVYKGVAKYTSNFVVPATSPDILPDTPSGVSGSSKLAKVLDSDTEGAVILDSDDYLSLADSNDFNLVSSGTGDFTIEFYVYLPDISARYVLSSGTDSTRLYINSSTRLHLNNPSDSFLMESSTAAAAIKANKWTHIAFCKSSSTGYIFVDGVQYSFHSGPTLGGSLDFNDLRIGRSSTSLNGFISNLRVIKGTAVYTSNFTPTSPLTNITNTKLLCCQSNTSAIAAAVTPGTITANGDATTSNFGLLNTDINTVRGQETGYCTLNPLAKNSSYTLSNGNLSYSGNVVQGLVASTIFASSGKYYCEFQLTTQQNDTGIGVGDERINPTEDWIGEQSYQVGYLSDGRIFQGGSATTYSGYGTSDTIGAAFDVDTGKVYFAKNNIWQNSGNPAAGTGQVKTISGGNPLTFTFRSVSSGAGTVNFGQKPFKFPPPAGFQSLNAANVRPETVITRPNQFVRVTTYTGNNGTQNINAGLKPDFVWIKNRSSSATDGNHLLFDTVRGVQNAIYSNLTDDQDTLTNSLTSFNSDGFTVGGPGASGNIDSQNYVAWSWKAGGNKNTFNVDDVGYASFAASGTTAGTITPTGTSIGTKQGFSIIKYQGTGANATIPHGLSQSLDFVIVKTLTDSSINWTLWHNVLAGTEYLTFTSNEKGSQAAVWNSTVPTSSVINVGTDVGTNKDNDNYIAYCWHNVPGLQKFGSYTGSSGKTFVNLGFRPALLVIKFYDGTDVGSHAGWKVIDNQRNPINISGIMQKLAWDVSEAENGGSTISTSEGKVDFISNGFRILDNHSPFNTAGRNYIYMAWAEAPASNLYGGQSNAR